jgi:hypothetical protein
VGERFLKEKGYLRKASKVGCIALLGLLLASIGVAVYAETAVNVLIGNPNGGSVKGRWSSGYWVGEIPITVSNGSPQQTVAYCMNYDKTIHVGITYPAELAAVMDTAEWKAVSYVLTWYHPPADSDAAVANQVAIWRLLDDGYVRPSWLDTSFDTAGKSLADIAKGKDVVRQGDVFQWIEPVTTNQSAVMGNPGETITFKAKLTDVDENPRSGVKVIFNATLRPDDVALGSAYLSPAVTRTDSNGIAEVTVKIPETIHNGDSIEVKGSTKSVWPQLYLDLNDVARQDLIGIGTTFELTVSTNVCVLAYILIIPEVPLGTLTAGVACAFAFVFWKKGGHLKRQKLN